MKFVVGILGFISGKHSWSSLPSIYILIMKYHLNLLLVNITTYSLLFTVSPTSPRHSVFCYWKFLDFRALLYRFTCDIPMQRQARWLGCLWCWMFNIPRLLAITAPCGGSPDWLAPLMSKLKPLPLYHRVSVFNRLFMTSILHLGTTSNEKMMVSTHRTP